MSSLGSGAEVAIERPDTFVDGVHVHFQAVSSAELLVAKLACKSHSWRSANSFFVLQNQRLYFRA